MRHRRASWIGLVLALVWIAVGVIVGDDEEGEPARSAALFDGPQGSQIGWVLDPTGLEVLETRDGWKRVQLEGWIPISFHSIVRGKIKGAAGTPLLLLADDSEWQSAWESVEESYRTSVTPLAEETVRIKQKRDQALQRGSFTAATEKYDELDVEYKASRNQLRAAQLEALTVVVAELGPGAVTRGSVAPDGTFALYPPGPGVYHLFVPLAGAGKKQEGTCCWIDLTVEELDLWIDLNIKKGTSKVRTTKQGT